MIKKIAIIPLILISITLSLTFCNQKANNSEQEQNEHNQIIDNKNDDDRFLQMKEIYLNSSYVTKNYQFKKGSDEDAVKIRNEAIKAHEEKDYKKAEILFLKSLYIVLSAETFYYYGNTLINLKEYINAINAYFTAEQINSQSNDNELKFDNQKKISLLTYNMACAYSLKGDIDSAFDKLKEAVDKGYTSINYMEKDTDLENVRNDKRWKMFYSILKNENISALENIVNKKVSMLEPSSSTDYFFYEENKVKRKTYCDPFTVLRGNWDVSDGIITLHFDQKYQKIGVGESTGGCSACSCNYDQYEEKNTEIDINEKIDLRNLVLDPDWWEITESNESFNINLL